MFRPEPFKLERFFAQHEFSARRLLCASDCESLSIRELLAMEPGAEARLLDSRLGYTETRGSPELRAAIAKRYRSLKPEDVFVHAGAEEGLLNLFAALVADGDRVVVATPCYQSLAELPRALGARILAWPWRAVEGRWVLDTQELAGLAHGARMIVLNLPHNPTGASLSANEFEEVIRIARREGAILLVDEVYRELERDGAERLSAACDAYERGVSLGVLSKNAGLAGLRIGWLASRDSGILDAVAQVKDYNSICSSGPSEVLACVALRAYERLTSRARAICADNLSSLEALIARQADFIEWIAPRGGSIAFPRLAPRLLRRFGDAEGFALALLRDTGLLILPGAYYDAAEAARFRVGFGRADFAAGLAELEAWLKR